MASAARRFFLISAIIIGVICFTGYKIYTAQQQVYMPRLSVVGDIEQCLEIDDNQRY